MEFWNDRIVEKSWEVLLELNKNFDFILIGGWATYLHTGAIRSKDIDLIMGFEELAQLRKSYNLKKNQHLKNYETLIKEISIGIYVPYFSELVIPAEDLENYTTSLQGIKVLTTEALLILKQEAEKDRSHSTKGQKDRTDILNLLINADVDLKKYKDILENYDLENYRKRLLKIVRNADKEFSYLGIEGPGKKKQIRKELADKLRKL